MTRDGENYPWKTYFFSVKSDYIITISMVIWELSERDSCKLMSSGPLEHVQILKGGSLFEWKPVIFDLLYEYNDHLLNFKIWSLFSGMGGCIFLSKWMCMHIIAYIFFICSFSILYILTGSEAMFADLGHFNPRSIQVILITFGLSFKVLLHIQPVIIFLFIVILVTDSFSIHNLPISSFDLCGTDSIPDQAPQRSWWWLLQICTNFGLLAYLCHCNIGCNCC